MRDQAGTQKHWRREVQFVFWDMRIVKLDTNFILPQCREPAIGRGTKTAQLRTFSKLLGTLTQAQPECMDSTLEKIPEASLRSRVGDFVEGILA